MALGEAYPLRLLCRLLEVPRSSLYYRPKGLGEEEERLCARLRELAGTWPRYGYRRLGALLREEGFRVGDKRVRSLMREEGLLLPRHPPKLKTSFPGVLPLGEGFNLLPGLEVKAPHEVWVADLSYVVLGEGTAYLAVVMDLYTRRVLGLSLGRRLSQGLALAALEQALREGVPRVHQLCGEGEAMGERACGAVDQDHKGRVGGLAGVPNPRGGAGIGGGLCF